MARDGDLCGDFGGFELVRKRKRKRKILHRGRGEHRRRREESELISKAEEILEELFAGCGEDGFRVELDAFDFVAAVAEAHDDAVAGFGGDG